MHVVLNCSSSSAQSLDALCSCSLEVEVSGTLCSNVPMQNICDYLNDSTHFPRLCQPRVIFKKSVQTDTKLCLLRMACKVIGEVQRAHEVQVIGEVQLVHEAQVIGEVQHAHEAQVIGEVQHAHEAQVMVRCSMLMFT